MLNYVVGASVLGCFGSNCGKERGHHAVAGSGRRNAPTCSNVDQISVLALGKTDTGVVVTDKLRGDRRSAGRGHMPGQCTS